MKILHKIGAISLGSTLCLLLCLPYASLASDMIALDFTGTIIGVTDIHGTLDGSVSPTDSFSRSITYNSDVIDGKPADTTWGSYPQNLPPSSFFVDLSASYSVDATDLYIGVWDDLDPTWDLFDIRQEGTPFSMNGLPGMTFTVMHFALNDYAGNALASDALPGLELDLADFPDGKDFYIAGCLDSEHNGDYCTVQTLTISGSIDTLTVPEPTANQMGCVSLGLLLSLAGLRSSISRRNVPIQLKT